MSENLHYPNATLYVLLLAAEEVLGRNGLASVLNQANLEYLVGKYPPNNMEYQIPFKFYGQIEQAIENFYGHRGAKAILLRVGRATFRYTLHEQARLLGLASLALKALPTHARQKLILSQFVTASTEHFNMPSTLTETEDDFIITRTVCPCQHRIRDTTHGACDHVTLGTLQEAVKWATGQEHKVEQKQCLNLGDAVDEFAINKQHTIV